MELEGFYHPLSKLAEYQRLAARLKRAQRGDEHTHLELLDAAKPFVLAALQREVRRPILVLTPRSQQARQTYDQLAAWLPDKAVQLYLYPEPDGLPYERIAPDPALAFQRLKVLHALQTPGERPPMVVASAIAASAKTLPPAQARAAYWWVQVSDTLAVDSLVGHLVGLGYVLESAVETPGAASRRGGIVDLFSPQMELPARLEFLGNRIESIRLFDPATQRSQQPVKAVDILPAREFLVPPGFQPERYLDRLDFSGCAPDLKEMLAQEMANIAQGKPSPEQELLASLTERASLLDFLDSAGALLVLDQPERLEAVLKELDEKARELREGQVERGELTRDFPRSYFLWEELQTKTQHVPDRLVLEPMATSDKDTPGLPFTPAPAFGGRMAELLRWLQESRAQQRSIVMVSQQAQRLSELLLEQDMVVEPQAHLLESPAAGSLTLVQGSLQEGWSLDLSPEHSVLLLTDAELFGVFKQRRHVARRPIKRETYLAELSPGDSVVHMDHGVGRFVGVVRREAEQGEQEYLLLEYAGGDRLYVPVEQIGRVNRYIAPGAGRGQPPTLSRLGTGEWERTKQRVKESARVIARELLEIYAARNVLPGHAFSPDAPWQQEMELAFPYVETPDQLQAIADVKADMEVPKPMDRLICGDVGYGKTEVALRAAFKAVMDGFQVAVLVPTTVLAQQHLQTFRQRMAPFPVRVEMLSRFLTDQEQRRVIQDLGQGLVEIVIGTHRLLQKDVQFKNLGLVVIDEEQRFGVAHKEQLKQMRKEVDVLTLSATPIPRTLHMALGGIRDMSTMATPPEERLPISTYVGQYDERLVRQAILRELERGGQVFFVHNRVHNIHAVAQQVQALVPEAQVIVAHGQMDEEQLERTMADFGAGKADVLVCTTIIESGLDMPNVNTLLVHDADRFGLAQLYQLRGRIGRGTSRAFAYFFFPRQRRMTETAERRLETLLEVTAALDAGGLGTGFRLALKDLEIRGAGNLLGAEQSGNMTAVGFDLYSRLLQEAVEELKARQEGRPLPRRRDEATGPTINLPVSAFLPDDYVEDTAMRLALYQRLVQAASPDEVADFEAELRDRFGPVPPPAQELLYVVRLRTLATRASAATVVQEDSQVVVRFPDERALLGKRMLLERLLGQAGQVGNTQFRIRMLEGWQEALLEALRIVAPQGQPGE